MPTPAYRVAFSYEELQHHARHQDGRRFQESLGILEDPDGDIHCLQAELLRDPNHRRVIDILNGFESRREDEQYGVDHDEAEPDEQDGFAESAGQAAGKAHGAHPV